MVVPKQYQSDVEAILARRYDNGGDLWATADGRLGVGSPFSTLDCALMLSELRMDPSEPILKRTAELILNSWREDGRFRLISKGTIYPCHTARVARVLCCLGYAFDSRLKKTFDHLLEIQHSDGGWRCNTYKFGKGPETTFSNPGPTLEALDAFRFTHFLNRDRHLDKAVEFLLDHWVTRKPLGPCHFGIGTLFMKVEFPFFRYNLFFYVYVLSFYDRAKKDPRFLEALSVLESKLIDGKVVVENPNRKLAGFSFCKKGEPSELATVRYREILKNTGRKA
ncbi:MAG: prenyltransferase [archaeon]|nr:prenyltransferase [archaeon]MCP8314267.1 prenyltransferase [archaeon]MCP8318084.1 prenyltransferase [archaeon]MCP8319960.1 prenyltransferase [archaeon]